MNNIAIRCHFTYFHSAQLQHHAQFSQKIIFASENMPYLRPSIYLAQKMGKGLGRSEVL